MEGSSPIGLNNDSTTVTTCDIVLGGRRFVYVIKKSPTTEYRSKKI